ncbi:polyhomeotic-like protein 2 [Tetranychus urticae]|uniref:PHD-type domain-containing protein n=1 Tax=Tetranychus urticae TaxID=32264 RepID=T1KXW7_TETUR|nr:polyhomeotic-like protein 2 [Tetranychus urticae]
MPARRKHFNNRHDPVPRARSQRKKIKKSLGPDFLDPSDLGYGYLKDTYKPKCYLCDFPISSGRDEKCVTCNKCNLKVHRRCLIPDDNDKLSISEEDWQCEKCTAVCSLCKLNNEAEPTIHCTICDTPYHIICIQLYSDQPKPKRQCSWVCKKCLDVAGDKLIINKEPSKENTSSNISNAHIKRLNMTNGKSHSLLVATANENNREPEDLLIDNSSTIELPDELETSIKGIEPSKAEIADYHAFVSDRLAKMVKSLSMDPDPKNWTTTDVESYIKEIGFPDQAHLFKEQLIDGRSLLLLRRVDVVKGLSMKLGPALKIYAHINQLQEIDIVPAFNSLESSQQADDNLNTV